MNDTVGIVIVSHSKDIAKGTADMVRQMVGAEVRVAFCGGNADGGLGTNVPSIIEAIDSAWSSKGVAVLVDLGGAETNSEMAVEMLQPDRKNLVVVCNAPIEAIRADLQRRAPDLERLAAFCDTHGFGPMLRRQAERLTRDARAA